MVRSSFDNTTPGSRGRLVGRIARVAIELARLLACGLAFGLISDQAIPAQEVIDKRLEYNVKAASLYAFGRYVTWPDSAFESADSPLVIGVHGGNPFGDALDRIAAKKTINGRPIEIRQVNSPADSEGCHILFVTRSVPKQAESQLFERTEGKPILLVGESPGFTDRGGTINFYHRGTNVRFELNPDQGLESQLSLSAKLLTLGTRASTTMRQ